MAQTPSQNIKPKRTKRLRTPSVSSSSTVDCSTSSTGLTHEQEQDHDLANSLILLAQGKTGDSSPVFVHNKSLFLYHCSTCDRCFPSFQALGGHASSHKKQPKFSNSTPLSLKFSTGRSPEIFAAGHALKSKVHECSVCGSGFASGQALGGHMRRHRALPAPPQLRELMMDEKRNGFEFDLNLPAPEDDRHRTAVAVFSAASPLLDCHY